MIRHCPCRCLICLLLGLAILLPGCKPSGPQETEAGPTPVTVSKPLVRKVVDFDNFDGHLKAQETVDIRARVRGYLDKVHFKAGTIVKKGDPLYDIDPRPAKADLDASLAQEAAAEAALQFAQAEYKRVKMLLGKGAASREEMDTWVAKQAIARADKQKAKASVERADLDLKFTHITAPRDGKMSKTQVDEGNLVNAGGGETLLSTLVSIDPIDVYFDVDERSLLYYRKMYRKELPNGEEPNIKDLHIPVYIALEGETGYPHKGEIDFSDNRVNSSTGTIEVRGVLSNKKRLFDDGMRARVSVPIGDPHTVLLVTERAIGNDQGKKFVYVVNKDNIVERRDVELGRLVEHLLVLPEGVANEEALERANPLQQPTGMQVIEKGLKPGDLVIVNNIQRAREGMTVKPTEIPMPGQNEAEKKSAEKTNGSK